MHIDTTLVYDYSAGLVTFSQVDRSKLDVSKRELQTRDQYTTVGLLQLEGEWREEETSL